MSIIIKAKSCSTTKCTNLLLFENCIFAVFNMYQLVSGIDFLNLLLRFKRRFSFPHFYLLSHTVVLHLHCHHSHLLSLLHCSTPGLKLNLFHISFPPQTLSPFIRLMLSIWTIFQITCPLVFMATLRGRSLYFTQVLSSFLFSNTALSGQQTELN